MTSVQAEEAPECTYYDPDTKNFYDLRPLIRESGEDWTMKPRSGGEAKLNVCHEILDSKTGLKFPQGVGSFYRADVKGYSIGKANTKPFVKEQNLMLKYVDGDECPGSQKTRTSMIFFECDNSVKGQGEPEFLAEHDNCVYMFRWKTPAACPVVQQSGKKLGGGAIFAIIMSVLAGVYLIGGIIYKRVVLGQRGLNQLPNAEYWRAIGNFVKNLFRMAFPSCCGNRSRQYNYGHLNTDEENVFIDEDDEE
ncbi:mannose 6-phosphate receptor domain-containing protein [Basidiobolus meristosporus CBS 931.73]|uniref:Mannose 6-phosphate receptor domain-containing protein n=1 Tax=Basidiobolus meristosporus CBS 931.73 TaxID=1314790 RepID=A0A1Y1X3U8_9FUNG|nr:mannose 6-phosphate receptor domain-containing protein [Basidiobolus meristosporus CBS 931.73]ORX80046.1 mannose 6-phosphate receptor domain-containing protein [Basidiobolus meristosporus CBS 931.73]|eukprot:ORX77463.1 mannose 6-phosphate receptor domain-containing protein [Basidiobolus meristosporus CBS 931.73]